MTELFRVRVEKSLLKDAEKVADEIGTTPQEAVRLFLSRLVKLRAIPFPLTADAPEDGLLGKGRRNQVLRELDDSEGW
jgi:addiction module RelB/DinJ family antitoxin